MANSDKNTPSSHCSVLDLVSHTVDTHLRLFRLLPWLLGATGLVIFYRHSRYHVRRFSQVTDIPQSCLAAHVPLHGVVVSLEAQSVGVWHVPLWKRWIRIDHKPPPGEYSHGLHPGQHVVSSINLDTVCTHTCTYVCRSMLS